MYAPSTEPAIVEKPEQYHVRKKYDVAREIVLTRSHRQVELGLGHEVDIRTDKAGRLALADEGGRSSDNCLSTRHVHGFEEEPCAKSRSVSQIPNIQQNNLQILDEPLHDTQIVEHLNERNEENDSGELQRKSDIGQICTVGFKLTVLTKNQWLFATVAGSKKKAAPCRP